MSFSLLYLTLVTSCIIGPFLCCHLLLFNLFASPFYLKHTHFIRELHLSSENYTFIRELHHSSENYTFHQRTTPFIRELPLSSENYPFHQRTTPFIREFHLASKYSRKQYLGGESLNLEKLYVYFQKKLKQNKTHLKSIRFSLNNLHLQILCF